MATPPEPQNPTGAGPDGGAIVGVALVTGLWTEFMVWARVWAGGFEVAL